MKQLWTDLGSGARVSTIHDQYTLAWADRPYETMVFPGGSWSEVFVGRSTSATKARECHKRAVRYFRAHPEKLTERRWYDED